MLFSFKLQQAGWQLLFGRVFSPLPWSTVACDTINSRVRRQRKRREDYEDEVSDRITLPDLFSLTHLESHLSQTKTEAHQSKSNKKHGTYQKGGRTRYCVHCSWVRQMFLKYSVERAIRRGAKVVLLRNILFLG